ncbi:TIGR00299 family protein [Geothermobacter hydrogeniphilus]|uniref:Putative nickel insertion protein n=1 Tax=Geothermobacter hydrogeniphilus TaxID=1969733 RepID=A0A2K2H6V3_9BACT|nr:nickel pincer cofactor biosynthesis protein LarC [Geothermobacter hydrogeniphilus]PNU18989.1 TIGR00299 family protein [Geothermobacter hydrogeniphilus]
MKTLYLDTFSGISGDMLLGLLIDLGLQTRQLEEGLKGLPVSGWRLRIGRESRQGLGGTRVEVLCDTGQPQRHWKEIDAMLAGSDLPQTVRDTARRIFRRLGEAEAKVHGCDIDQVHFHEVGAVDAIIDICGAALGLSLLGIEQLICAPLPLSRGFVDTAHGRMPLPAPATAELLTGHPVCDADSGYELVTPTGAAIVVTLARFGSLPPMRLDRVGCGVGGRDLADRPNLLRGFLGHSRKSDPQRDQVAVLESHLDDGNPEWLGHLMDQLFAAGALDVVFSPLQMKKNRPATAVRILARPEQADALAQQLLRQSSAGGVRIDLQRRLKLRREAGRVSTPWGEVAVKLFFDGGRLLRVTPEFEDCRRLAERHQIDLPDIYRAVERAADVLFTRKEQE